MKIKTFTIKGSSNPREATDYLLQCLEDGMIGVEDVVMEFCKYCSDDEVREVCEQLGLYEIEY